MIGFFSLLLLITITIQKPIPKCKTGFYYRTLPLIADESAILRLDSIFNGYNLNYNLSGQEEWKDYITLGEKMKGKKEVPDVPMVGLKNYHIQRKGNAWGKSFIALAERGERTYVHFGILNNNESAPIINLYISVENNTNTTCYDAVVFMDKGIIIVDCAVHTSKDSHGYSYHNLFYYFKISDGSFIKSIEN